MFVIGQCVKIRDQKWRVLESQAYENGFKLVVQGIDELNQFKMRTFYYPIDNIEILGSAEFKWHIGLYYRWRNLNDAILFSMVHGDKVISSLNYGRLVTEKYQFEPVLKCLKLPLPRILIADDVGLGKTIEAGLIMMELIARGRGNRILIVTPAALQDQWADEMKDKFNLDFKIFDSDNVRSTISQIPLGLNPWSYESKIITSIDYTKREDVKRKLKNIKWDLVIIDEAHYLSSKKNKPTDRSRFGTFISTKTEGLILLSATPHDGYSEGFYSLIKILNEFIVPENVSPNIERVKEYFIRRLKSQITDDDGKPKFVERTVENISVVMGAGEEKKAYDEICAYCKRNFRKAKKNARFITEAFAMTVIKKRLLSSYEAVKKSLEYRYNNLSSEDVDIDAQKGLIRDYAEGLPLNENQQERVETALLKATSYQSSEDIEKEKKELLRLIQLVEKVIMRTDSKKQKLLELLNKIFKNNEDRKAIIFTEYRDTQSVIKEYLEKKGYNNKIVIIHGNFTRKERLDAEDQFEKPESKILLATDAASEGLNFQNYCHTVLHNELPWNPNRLEQRNGRVDRWGQKHKVVVYNLLYTNPTKEDTFETEIFKRLLAKIDTIKKDLGSISTVVGITDSEGLSDVLMDTGDEEIPDQKKVSDFFKDIDDKKKLIEEYSEFSLLKPDNLSQENLKKVNDAITLSQPYNPTEVQLKSFVESCIKDADGELIEEKQSIYRIKVPYHFWRQGVEKEYVGIFDKKRASDSEFRGYDYFSLNHPLINSIISTIRSDIYQSKAIDRISYKVTNLTTHKGIIFTFLVKFFDGLGKVAEERLLPVFVDGKHQNKLSAEESFKIILSDPIPINVNAKELNAHYEDGFKGMEESAKEHLKVIGRQILKEIQDHKLSQKSRLEKDVQQWRTSKNQYLKDKLAVLPTVQRTLMNDQDPQNQGIRLQRIRLQNQIDSVELEYKNNIEKIDHECKIKDDFDYELIGALVVVPK